MIAAQLAGEKDEYGPFAKAFEKNLRQLTDEVYVTSLQSKKAMLKTLAEDPEIVRASEIGNTTWESER